MLREIKIQIKKLFKVILVVMMFITSMMSFSENTNAVNNNFNDYIKEVSINGEKENEVEVEEGYNNELVLHIVNNINIEGGDYLISLPNNLNISAKEEILHTKILDNDQEIGTYVVQDNSIKLSFNDLKDNYEELDEYLIDIEITLTAKFTREADYQFNKTITKEITFKQDEIELLEANNTITVNINSDQNITTDLYVCLIQDISHGIVSKIHLDNERQKTINVNSNSLYTVRLATLKNGKSYNQNYDGNNVYNSVENGKKLGYKYTVTYSNTESIRFGEVNISLSSNEENNVSKNDIKTQLNEISDFAVYANEFANKNHMEGNIAVNLLSSNNSTIGLSGNEVKVINSYEIEVNKTVTPAKEGTYRFGLFYKYDNGDSSRKKPVQIIEVKTDSTGTGSNSFKIKGDTNLKDIYEIYELDENNNKIYNGDISEGYKAIYETDLLSDSFSATHNVDYIKDTSGITSIQGQGNIELVTTETVKNKSLSIRNFKEITYVDDNKFPIDINAGLSRSKTLSQMLYKAKTNDELEVFSVDASDFENANLDEKLVISDSSKYAVVNVIVPNNQFTLNAKVSFQFGDTVVNNANGWTPYASQIIWNFVNEDGTPYTGKVSTNVSFIGTMLIPDGSLSIGPTMCGSVIANYVENVNGEIHKVPVTQEENIKVSLEVTNKLVTIEATKILEGKELEDNEFEFTLVQVDENQNDIINGYTETATNDKDGNIIFNNIQYSDTDVGNIYYYKISEVIKNDTHIVYDKEDKYIEVTVYKDDEGNIYCEQNTDVVFTNQYIETQLNGSLTITKKSIGQTTPETTSFTIIGPNDYQKTILYKEFTNGSYTINNLPVGEYTITESNASIDGYILTLTGDTSVIVDTNETTAVITNTYKASGKAQLKAYKQLTGKTLVKDQFTFELLENNTVIQTAKNDEKGNIQFDEINYTKTGTYKYVIKEVNDKQDGITYDTNEYEVIVEVTDNEDGTLKIKISYPQSSVTFKNKYQASGSINITANKVLVGKTLTEKQFTFTLIEVDRSGKALTNGYTQTASNDINGNIVFSNMKYDETQIGEHYYKISEENAGTTIDGITYDNEYKIVKITVTDNNDGTLSLTQDTIPTFTNTYKTNKASINITAHKTLLGKILNDKQFTFILSENGKEISRTTNDINGNIIFDSIEYTKTGTYTYIITEVNDKQDGIIYDSNEYQVEVNVIDNGKGILTTQITSDEITFTNKYESDKYTQLVIYKIDQDKNFLAGASFTLTDSTGTIINPTAGKARFIFNDLKDGNYILTETQTPAGYDGIEPFEIIISNGLINVEEYEIYEASSLSIMNTNNDMKTTVLGDSVDNDNYNVWVKEIDISSSNDINTEVLSDNETNISHKVIKTSDNLSIIKYSISMILMLGLLYTIKKIFN